MTDYPEMTLEEFRTLLESRGAKRESWPEDRAEAAADFLVRSPDAQLLFRASATLDAVLDTAPQAEPSAALRARVLAIGPQGDNKAKQPSSGFSFAVGEFFSSLFRPAVAGAAIAGIAIGVAMTSLTVSEPPVPVPASPIATPNVAPPALAPVLAVARNVAAEQTQLAASLGGDYTPALALVNDPVYEDQDYANGSSLAAPPLY